MENPTFDPRWIAWAKALQAHAQVGLVYARDDYDRERYGDIMRIAAEIVAHQSQIEPARVMDVFQQQSGYATPKVDVRGVVFRDGKLLMVREKSEGLWTLPGGWADINEAPAAGVAREVREESGIEAEATKLLAVYDRSLHPHDPPFAFHVYKLYFLCRETGGDLRAGTEADEAGFFGEDEMPPLSVSRVTPQQIARIFEHLRHPGMPTDFDR